MHLHYRGLTLKLSEIDGFHLDEEGHETLADLLMSEIKKILHNSLLERNKVCLN